MTGATGSTGATGATGNVGVAGSGGSGGALGNAGASFSNTLNATVIGSTQTLSSVEQHSLFFVATAGITITLPTSVAGKLFHFRATYSSPANAGNSGGNAFTITAPGSLTLRSHCSTGTSYDKVTSLTIGNYVEVVGDGTDWNVVSAGYAKSSSPTNYCP